MTSPPEMPSTVSDGATLGNRPLDFRHMTTLTNQALFLHEKLALILRIRATRPRIVELHGSRHDIMAAITDLGRSEGRIKLGGMRRRRIVIWTKNLPIPNMTSGARHTFLLVFRIVPVIRNLNGFFDAATGKVLNKSRLLIFQWRMAIQTDPDIVIFFPIGLKKWIVKGLGMNTGFPLFVDLDMTTSTFLRFQALQSHWNLLIGNGFRVILS